MDGRNGAMRSVMRVSLADWHAFQARIRGFENPRCPCPKGKTVCKTDPGGPYMRIYNVEIDMGIAGRRAAHRFAAVSLQTERRKGAEGHFFKFCSLGRKTFPPFWTNGPFRVVNRVKSWMSA